MRGKLFRIAAFCAFTLTCTFPSFSQSDIPKVANAYILQNVTLVSEPGAMTEGVNVHLEDGMIKAIGFRIPVPSHAKVINCSGLYAYAGFIEGISYTGVAKPESNNDLPKVKDPGNPPNDRAGIQPERSVMDLVKNDKSFGTKRELGFTASHIVPRGGMLPGQGAVLLLGSGTPDDLLLKKDVSTFAQFAPARRMYPATAIGIMSKWKELFRQAEMTSKYKSDYDNPENTGLERPKFDRALEGMFPVTDGSRMVFFNTPEAMDIFKAQLLQQELGFNLVLAETKDAWYASDAIVAAASPVIVSMDLPDDKSSRKDNEEKEESEEVTRLKERRAASLSNYRSQAARLVEMGTPIAFSMLEVKSKDFHANLLTMIENGLTEDQALAALTTAPAEMFGLSSYMGTVDAGKMANLVLSQGPYFTEDAQVRYVFVEGEMFEYEIKEKKKKKEGDDVEAIPADMAGTWSFEIDIPGQTQTGNIFFQNTDGDISGVIEPDGADDSVELYNIEVDGATVTFSLDFEDSGQSIQVDFEITVDGDTFEGDVDVGPMGSFPVEGDRNPNN